MAHLLMIESWVGTMSTLLPRAIREAGHSFTFLTRDLHHYLRSATGTHPLLGARNVLTTETNDLPALLDHIERAHDLLAFDGVLTSCDYYLAAVAEVAARLGLPGTDPQAVRTAGTKHLARAALAAADVPGPRFAVVESAREAADAGAALGYPLVVKPVDLCAGMYVREVADATGLARACLDIERFPVNARGQRRNPALLLEELLTGPEFSVEVVACEGEYTVVGVTDKSVAGHPSFVETGHMFPAALPEEQHRALADTAVAALRALGVDHGVSHTELKLTPEGPRVVEVNCRPGGNQITELVRRVTGIDLPIAYTQLAIGEKPDCTPVGTGVRSAAISFLLPPGPGRIERITGTEALDAPDVVDWSVKPAGHMAGPPTSNNNYLGHAMVIDGEGAGARDRADGLVAGLTVEYAASDEAEGAA